MNQKVSWCCSNSYLEERREKNQNRWGKWIKKEPQNNVDKLEETKNAKEDLEEEKDEERGRKEGRK